MLKTIGSLLGKIPFVARVRRNHAMEHATIHMLSRRVPNLRAAGYSLPMGFVLIGALETETVVEAAEEALARLHRGEWQWALHPNCGTSLLTTGVMAALASSLSIQFTRRPEERPLRFPTAVMFIIMAMVLSRPLGLNLQRYVTTEPRLDGMRILGVRRLASTPVVMHWIETG